MPAPHGILGLARGHEWCILGEPMGCNWGHLSHSVCLFTLSFASCPIRAPIPTHFQSGGLLPSSAQTEKQVVVEQIHTNSFCLGLQWDAASANTHTHTHFPATLKLQLASIMFSHQYWIEQIIMWWLYNSSVCFSEVNWGKQSGAGCLHPLSIPVVQIYSLLGQNVPPRGPPVRLPWRILSSVTKLSPKVSTFCWTLLSHFPHCTIHNVILPLQVWSAWDYVCGISPHLTEMEWVVRTVCSRAFTQRWSCVSVQH